jgi:hypothetical protein
MLYGFWPGCVFASTDAAGVFLDYTGVAAFSRYVAMRDSYFLSVSSNSKMNRHATSDLMEIFSRRRVSIKALRLFFRPANGSYLGMLPPCIDPVRRLHFFFSGSCLKKPIHRQNEARLDSGCVHNGLKYLC